MASKNTFSSVDLCPKGNVAIPSNSKNRLLSKGERAIRFCAMVMLVWAFDFIE